MSQAKTAEKDLWDWLADGRYVNQRSAKIAWSITIGAVLVALASLALISVMLPLKTVEPVFVRVDSSTGILDVFTTLAPEEINKTDAIVYADVAKYVRLRQQYVRDTYADAYVNAVKFSTGVARKELTELYAPDAKRSPIKDYGDRVQLNVRFKSTFAHVGDKVVRAEFIVDEVGGRETISRHYVATITYDHVADQSLSWAARLDNPLAFVVTNYQLAEQGALQ